MRRRNRMGYKGYQGRGGGSSGWLKALVLVLAMLVVGAGGYLLAQNGGISLPSLPTIQIQLPTGGQNQDPATAGEGDGGETASPEDSTSPEPSATPSQAPAVTEIRAVEVTLAQLLDGSAQHQVEQADCDALVVEVKGNQGRLQWPSQVAKAQEWGAVANQQSLTDALKTLSDQGIYLVARVDCFRDQLLSVKNVDNSLLMTRGGNRWYDSMGKSWVTPVSQTVRDYMVELCVELSGMGFDELVLDSAYFPDQGEVHVLAQSDNYPDARTAPVETFWKQVSTALEGKDVVLSAQVRGDSLLNGGTTTGMTPQLLQAYTQRVWVTLDGADQTQVKTVLTQAGMDAAGQIVEHTANNGQKIWSQE